MANIFTAVARKAITSTAAPISAVSEAIVKAWLQAPASNATPVYIGASDVAPATSYIIAPGSEIVLEGGYARGISEEINLNDIYARTSNGTIVLHIAYLTRS